MEDPPLDEADGVEDPPPVYGLVSLTHHGRALTLQDVVPNRGRPDGAHGLGTLTECRLCKAMTFWDATGEHLGTHGVTPELCAEADQHMKDWMGDWKRRREQKRRKRK